jgi:hypothetical protein
VAVWPEVRIESVRRKFKADQRDHQGGEIEEFDREIDRYRKMLDSCGVGQDAQANIFGGTLSRLASERSQSASWCPALLNDHCLASSLH